MKRLKKSFLKPLLLTIVILLALIIWKQDTATAPDVQTNNSTPVVSTEPEPVATFNKTQLSLTDPVSTWVVVNKQRPLNPLTYTPTDLIDVGGGQQMRKEAGDAFAMLKQASQAAGNPISPLSGYRSYARQQVVYQNEVNNYGQAVADTESAKPGYSEHQTGLAIDVGGGGCGIEDCFGNTTAGKWLAANAYLYGFIIRYPEGKQAITGYRYEPWHIRYVGVSLATEMKNKNIATLEEFFGL